MAETVKKKSTPAKTAAKNGAVKATVTAKPRKSAAKKPVLAQVTEMPLTHEAIASLAHRYWAERGHQHGHHVEDWLRAEQELRKKAS